MSDVKALAKEKIDSLSKHVLKKSKWMYRVDFS
jgi:hypothetical protein